MDTKFIADLWAVAMSHPEASYATLALIGAVYLGSVGLAWWLRGHLVSERLELLRAQRDDFNAKLEEGKGKLAELEKQIAERAATPVLVANATHTAGIFTDLQIISNNMGVTLTPPGGVYRVIIPRNPSDFETK